jgi:2,4-dienoyl-CoA reductase-like NADH-dependent reductase (Old Yellow Enzyme family)
MVSALFSPIQVKDVRFRNRVVMPPMVTLLADEAGRVTDDLVEHYLPRARAGTALIIVEATCVDEKGRIWERGIGAWSDDHVSGLARLAGAIKGEGAVAGIQLVHGGPQTSVELCGERLGPSEADPPQGGPRPRAMTVAEIRAAQQSFVSAAARCAEAGFDLVEVHGAHDYLLDSFVSAATNQRTDEYGDAFRNRIRNLVETCARVKDRAGDKPLVCCRFSIFNKEPGEWGTQDLELLVGELKRAGVDVLHASTDGALKPCLGTGETIGRLVKRATDLPIIVAGGLGNPHFAERAVADGHADFAAIGQAMFDDTDWTIRAKGALGA